MDPIGPRSFPDAHPTNDPLPEDSLKQSAAANPENQEERIAYLDRNEETDRSSAINETAPTMNPLEQANLEKKKKESIHLTGIGIHTLKILKMIMEYFEVHDLDDVDELSEAGDIFGLGDISDESKSRLTTSKTESLGNLQPLEQSIIDQSNVEDSTTKEPQIGPKLRAEIYKYVRNKEDYSWAPKLESVLDGTAQIIVDESDEPSLEATSTFEVTTMYAKAAKPSTGFRDTTKSDSKVKVLAHVETYMTIHSEAILNALREVIDYYPMISYRHQSPLVIIEPFCILLHYKDELTEYRDKLVTQTNILNPGAASEVSHLTPLVDYLCESYNSVIAEEKNRWQQTRPTCTFEWLWLLFRPGSTVVACRDEVYYAYTVLSHSKERKPDRQGRVKAPEGGYGTLKFLKWHSALVLKMWFLNYDGNSVGRQEATVRIAPFEGEKALDTLPVIPLSYWKDIENNQTREDLQKRLIERGKSFLTYTKHTYCEYSGKATSWPYRTIHGRIMIDTELRYSESVVGGSKVSRPRLGINEDQDRINSTLIGVSGKGRRGVEDSDDDDIESGVKARFTHPDDQIDPSKVTTLSDRQYMICYPSVWAFVTKMRQWELLNVEDIKPLQSQEDLINDLVLEDNAKAMIKALARSYTTARDSTNQVSRRWTADFIQNKGDGQIFLLHGKPGVGKTTTAECVAELTKRPLLSLTCGDLGTEPKEVESRLMAWLRIATVWEAILLLDEADVYLESRRAQDLQRNSLVSIFLRALEYYQGILFLTSNRVGSFDDAFISRIHVIIHYPSFSPEQRQQIWTVFFRRLEKERSNIRITPSIHDYVENDEQLKQLEWNGREIRNAFNTAVALAEYENDVTDFHGQSMINFHRRHLEQVVKMSKAFRKYLLDTHGADEAKRARLERVRID